MKKREVKLSADRLDESTAGCSGEAVDLFRTRLELARLAGTGSGREWEFGTWRRTLV